MDELTSYWNSLAENSALLLVVMPLVGALLVRVMGVSGKETTYFTALTNVWLTTALGAIMLVRFEASELRESGASLKSIQIASSLEWLGSREPDQSDEAAETPNKRRRVLGPDIRFDVGVCRLSLWSILIVTATTLACVSNRRCAAGLATLVAAYHRVCSDRHVRGTGHHAAGVLYRIIRRGAVLSGGHVIGTAAP